MIAKERYVYMILDLQFGSTGKGLLAGYLAEKYAPDTVVTAWGSNSGHTYIDSDGRKFVHTMVANGVVSPRIKRLLLGPGSVINPNALRNELKQVSDLLQHVDVLIHPCAAIIGEEHRIAEQEFHAIGSTKKGVGAAIIDRIGRYVDNPNIAAKAMPDDLRKYVCTMNEYRDALNNAAVIQIEGAQGFSLSIYHGFYPYVTSRDVTPAQIMADCGIPIHWLTDVIGTMRTFPIRVANRYDGSGNQIGWSGPWYEDQQEIKWSDLGLKPELTTVTKLPRRIATFSMMQLREALWQTGATRLFLNFVNYLQTDEQRRLPASIGHQILSWNITGYNGDVPGIEWVGNGPTVDDVIDLQYPT